MPAPCGRHGPKGGDAKIPGERRRKMAYCVYLRKSRADQEAEARGEGETLARHERTLLALAERLGMPVAPGAIYREIVSGDTIAARPMMQRLLQEVQEGRWEGVLCMEVERLARGDTIDQGLVAQAFKYSGAKIITPVKTYDPENEMDEEFFEFSLFMARREYKAIKRRMQAGRAASVREGHYVGGKRPFGYRVVKVQGGKGYTLQQIPEEAAIVRQVFDWYLSGDVGAAEIANRLNALGATTYNGCRWDRSRIGYLLHLPVYAGYVQWLRREQKLKIVAGERVSARLLSDRYICARGLHAPVVTPEEFRAAAAIAKSRATRPEARAPALQNPLAGLLKCGLCGHAMVRRPNPNGVFIACRTPGCKCSGTSLAIVVEAVLESLRSWAASYGGEPAPPAPPPRKPDEEAAQTIARDAVDTARRQLLTAQEMLERGVYSVDEYVARKAALEKKIAAAEEEARRLRAQSAAPDEEMPPRASAPRLCRVLDAWAYADCPLEQNRLLRCLLARVDYTKTCACTRSDDPRAFFSLVLYPLQTQWQEE